MATYVRMLFNIGFGVIKTLFAGFILSKMWTWFIVSRFGGVPMLDYAGGVGLMLFISFFGIGRSVTDIMAGDGVAKVDTITRNLALICVAYPLVFLMAYLWHCVVG